MSNSNYTTKTKNIDLKEILLQGAKVWNRWREENPDFDINLREADLRGANLIGANLRGADLREADLRGTELTGANLTGANLRGADLGEADLGRADLGGADLRRADLRLANLRVANLRVADLSEADLKGTDLRGTDLTGADLTGADLREADLRGANLIGANLRGADLNRTNLHRTGIAKTVDVEVNILDKNIEDKTIENLESTIDEFMALQGYQSPEVIDEEIGSLFKKLRYRISKVISTEQQHLAYEQLKQDLNEGYARGKDNIRNQLEQPSVEATEQISKVTANIIKSLDNVDNVAIRLGKLIIIKTTDANGKSNIMAETISQELQNRLDSDPNFLKDPQSVAKFLQDTGAALKTDF